MDVLLCGALDEGERRAWLAALEAALPEARFVDLEAARAAPGSIEIALVANPAPGSLQGLPNLRLIQSLWAGVDRVVADPTVPPDVPLARMVDPAMTAAMTETAVWATLCLHRGFFDYARQQGERLWRPLPQRRADEVRVAVLGLGEMGRAAATALAAVGYRVTGWSRSPRAAPPGVAAASGAEALGALLADAQIVINLLPLTDATRGILDARLFAALPRGAGVVNLARGGHLVEADLLAALDSGAVGRAVLDVFQTEPLPAQHPFWTHPRVTLLPHAAAITDERSAAGVVAHNVRALLDGRPLEHLVDRRRGY